jgi:hypothetical protein
MGWNDSALTEKLFKAFFSLQRQPTGACIASADHRWRLITSQKGTQIAQNALVASHHLSRTLARSLLHICPGYFMLRRFLPRHAVPHIRAADRFVTNLQTQIGSYDTLFRRVS